MSSSRRPGTGPSRNGGGSYLQGTWLSKCESGRVERLTKWCDGQRSQKLGHLDQQEHHAMVRMNLQRLELRDELAAINRDRRVPGRHLASSSTEHAPAKLGYNSSSTERAPAKSGNNSGEQSLNGDLGSQDKGAGSGDLRSWKFQDKGDGSGQFGFERSWVNGGDFGSGKSKNQHTGSGDWVSGKSENKQTGSGDWVSVKPEDRNVGLVPLRTGRYRQGASVGSPGSGRRGNVVHMQSQSTVQKNVETGSDKTFPSGSDGHNHHNRPPKLSKLRGSQHGLKITKSLDSQEHLVPAKHDIGEDIANGTGDQVHNSNDRPTRKVGRVELNIDPSDLMQLVRHNSLE